MPIRFRCPNCQQLMGIARRKAGQTVNCPTCEREIRVPSGAGVPAAANVPRAPVPAAAEGGQLFDRSDFDAMLHAPPGGAGPAPVRLPVTGGAAVEAGRAGPELDVEPVQMPPAPAPPGGLVLSSRQVTMAVALAVIIVAGAFAVGVVVGHYLL